MLDTEMDFQQESWVQATFPAEVFIAYRGSFNEILNPCQTSFTDPRVSSGVIIYAGCLNVLAIKSNDGFSNFIVVEVCSCIKVFFAHDVAFTTGGGPAAVSTGARRGCAQGEDVGQKGSRSGGGGTDKRPH